jgi:hypothetical protein
MKKIIAFVLFAFVVTIKAQNPIFQWAKSIGSSGGGDDQGRVIKTDASGNVFVGGFFTGSVDFDPSSAVFMLNSNNGSMDMFLAKYSSSGALVWVHAFGNSGNDILNSIDIDASGDLYVSGGFMGSVDLDPSSATSIITANLYYQNFFIAKYTNAGAYVWAKAMTGNGGSNTTATIDNKIELDNVGNIFMCGNLNGVLDFDPSPTASSVLSATNGVLYVAKYDNNGNFLFANNFASNNASVWNYIYDFTLDASNNVYITGTYSGTKDFDPSAGVTNLTPNGTYDVYLVKYNSSGAIQWALTTDLLYCRGVAIDASGNVCLAADATGFFDIDPSPATFNLSCGGNTDFALVKFSNAGNFITAKNMGGLIGTASNYIHDLVIDASNNLYISGAVSGGFDFDPSPTSTYTVSSGLSNIYGFIAKYDTGLNLSWAFANQGNAFNITSALHLDNSSQILATGLINGTADVDPSAGVFNLSSGNNNTFFVSKHNTSTSALVNAFVPQETMGGSDKGLKIKKDALGNFFAMGTFNGVVDFDAGPGTTTASAIGNNAVFVTKYDFNGNFIWVRTLNGVEAYDIHLDNTNNVLLTGGFTNLADLDPSAGTYTVSANNQNGDIDAFFTKWDNNGNFVWGKSFGGVGGVVGADFGYNIMTNNTGEIFLSGIYQSPVVNLNPAAPTSTAINAGGFDMFLSKFTSAGNFVWGKTMTGGGNQIPHDMVMDASGNIYVTGMLTLSGDFDPSVGSFWLTSVGFNDVFVAKYDASGNFVNAFSIGASSEDAGYGITLDASANVYLTGRFWGTADFDPSPATANLLSSGGPDIFIAKYTSSLNYVFANKMGSSTTDEAKDIALDAAGNIYITGVHSGTCDFDPSPATANLATGGGSNYFIAGYSPSCAYKFAFSFGTTPGASGSALFIDGNSLFTTGTFNGLVACDPAAPSNTIISSASSQDILINKYDISFLTALAQQTEANSKTSLYPNPATNAIRIVANDTFDTFVIYDLMGRMISTGNYDEVINVSQLTSGVYFIKLNTKNDERVLKFTKE